MFQRTPFSLVIKSFTDRMDEVGLENNWFGLQGPPQFWLGDCQICVSPGKGSTDEGSVLGIGIDGTLIKRPIICTIMSRSYEDEGERATVALYGHLAVEETLTAALHLYMPTGVNTIVVEPFKLAETEQPQQKQGIITSLLVFDAVYPALLQSFEDGTDSSDNWDGILKWDTNTGMSWGGPSNELVNYGEDLSSSFNWDATNLASWGIPTGDVVKYRP
jgi:hypothetical protein